MIVVKDKYPSKIDTSDPAYPQGKARNVTVQGDGTGTPWEKDLVNDVFGFQQAVIKESGLTPSGVPDNADSSQCLEGIKKIVGIDDLSLPYVFETVADMVASAIVFPVGKTLKTKGFTSVGDGGGASYIMTTGASPTYGSPAVVGGHAAYQPEGKINALAIGVINGADSKTAIQSAQDLSELHKQPVDFSGLSDIRFTGGITYASWLEWAGAGKSITVFTPTDKTSTLVGSTHWISKADETVSTEHLLMQDFGVDGEWAGGFPTGDSFLGWCLVKSDGSNDKDITYLRLSLKDIPYDATLHTVKVTGGISSGGTIDDVKMLFCSGLTDHVATPNRNCNMFKTIHGSIGDPGPYGEYPITNVVSFGNTATGMRSLCDFKRGTRHFSHNNSTVIDNSDVCSISVDGGKDGTIGPNNTGYQTTAFADAKNFYEVQGEDIEILGGTWDANNRTSVSAGVLVTDYIYPSETVVGTYESNPSVNVNCRGITIKNIGTAQSAVRYINTKTCDVRGVNAFSIGFSAVSFEYTSGLKDVNGVVVIPQGNTVDEIKERDCTWALSVDDGNLVQVGANISDANGQANILIENDLVGEPSMIPLYIPEELNINKDFENYAGTAQQPLAFQSGAAVRNVQSVDKPYGVLKALELDDTSAVAVESCTYEVSIPCEEGDIFFFTLDTKLDTSTRSSLNIQEFNDGTFVSNGYITLNAISSWERRVRKYTVTGASTTRILININPAANSNVDSSFTGKSLFANFRVSRNLNNY